MARWLGIALKVAAAVAVTLLLARVAGGWRGYFAVGSEWLVAPVGWLLWRASDGARDGGGE